MFLLIKLTGLSLKSDINNTFSQLNEEIAGATEFQINHLANGFSMTYYDANDNNVSNNKQSDGTFYVQIKAANSDSYWTRISQKLLFTLNGQSKTSWNNFTF